MDIEKAVLKCMVTAKNKKLFDMILAKGFRPAFDKTKILIEDGKVQQVVQGTFPGGQKYLDDEIADIQNQIGPCKFWIEFASFDKEAFLEIREQLAKSGFQVLEERDTFLIYLEYANNFEDAISIIWDILSTIHLNLSI